MKYQEVTVLTMWGSRKAKIVGARIGTGVNGENRYIVKMLEPIAKGQAQIGELVNFSKPYIKNK